MRSDKQGKVSARIEKYLRDSGYSIDGYKKARFHVSVGRFVLNFPNPGRLPYHDLHHVVSGYGTGLVGEAEVSAYELRCGSPTLLVLFLCLGSISIGSLLSPIRVVRPWRNARGTRTLYDSPIVYKELKEMGICDLRASLNIPAEGWGNGTKE